MRRSHRSAAAPVAAIAIVLATLLVAPIVMTARPASAAGPSTFVFSGSGFGHGVGMSQYGAYGQALEGRTATQILQHYYTGAAVGPVADAVPIRVNLVHAAAGGSVQVRGETLGAGGGTIQINVDAAPPVTGLPNEAFVLGTSGGQVTVARPGGAVVASGSVATVTWSGTPTLLNVIGPGQTFTAAGHRYRYGLVDVAVHNGALEVVNQLQLHGEYLRGISEVPSSWPDAVLQAQAVAARTYAIRRFQAGQRSECRCHVYDTVVDQVFDGWSKESGPSGSRWVAAVDATQPEAGTGLIATYQGQPISANYFSSSGGRTENNEDGFGTTTAFPYLRSVDDHWSLDSRNPRASWSFTKSQAEVAAAFGLPDVVSIDLTSRTAGGSVKTAIARSSTGQSASIAGSTLRSRLSLPGAWLRKPVVRVAGADRFSTSVAIGQAASGGGTSAVIASGETDHLVDGLVAAPLAKAKGAPLLLATAASLPPAVADEIDRRNVTTAYLVGGAGALGAAVEAQLRARGVTTIERLAGDDRYGTGLAVAREIGGTGGQAFIASGDAGHLVDALGAGGAAAALRYPILLVERDAVPAATRQALAERGVTATIVVGGVTAVSDAVVATLPSPRRLAGADRFTTAIAVANDVSGVIGVSSVTVGSGDDAHLVDALPGGALARVTLLTSASALTTATRDWLRARVDVGGVQVLGGTAAVSAAAFDAIRAAVGG